jgi:UDP-N-acetylmuramyl tripeptide synthase
MDRRLAIREGIKMAQTGDTVIITGKGTDQYIMGPEGSKIPWSDAKVAREELERMKTKSPEHQNSDLDI